MSTVEVGSPVSPISSVSSISPVSILSAGSPVEGMNDSSVEGMTLNSAAGERGVEAADVKISGVRSSGVRTFNTRRMRRIKHGRIVETLN